MKTDRVLLVAGALLTLFIPWTVSGQAARPHRPDILRFDRNGDNKISRSELPEWMRRPFDRVDVNHDGFITPEEDRAFRAARSKRRKRAAKQRGPSTPPTFADVA